MGAYALQGINGGFSGACLNDGLYTLGVNAVDVVDGAARVVKIWLRIIAQFGITARLFGDIHNRNHLFTTTKRRFRLALAVRLAMPPLKPILTIMAPE